MAVILAGVAVMFSAMLFLVKRHVFALVPTVLYKVDPLVAGIVRAAVFAPVLGMARGDMQVDRRALDAWED